MKHMKYIFEKCENIVCFLSFIMIPVIFGVSIGLIFVTGEGIYNKYNEKKYMLDFEKQMREAGFIGDVEGHQNALRNRTIFEAMESPSVDLGDITAEESYKIPEEKYCNPDIKIVYCDVINGTTDYIDKVTSSNKINYEKIVNSTEGERATFMTLFTYYFTYVAKFGAYMGNYKNIKQYLDDKDRFTNHNAVERAVEYSLSALYHTYTNNIYMSIEGDEEGCDLGGLMTNYYWFSIGIAPDIEDNLLYWLSGDCYDKIAKIYCEKYQYGEGGYSYRVKGGVLSTMMRDLDEYGNAQQGIYGEFAMDDIWIQQFKYANIKNIYEKWLKNIKKQI